MTWHRLDDIIIIWQDQNPSLEIKQYISITAARATDKQRICVFTQLKCLKTQLRFTGLRTEKQKKSLMGKSDYFLCVQPYFNFMSKYRMFTKLCLHMRVVTIEHMCLFLELGSRFSVHIV